MTLPLALLSLYWLSFSPPSLSYHAYGHHWMHFSIKYFQKVQKHLRKSVDVNGIFPICYAGLIDAPQEVHLFIFLQNKQKDCSCRIHNLLGLIGNMFSLIL